MMPFIISNDRLLGASRGSCLWRAGVESVGGRLGVGFGDRLRREREMRGISLEEIATATKIGTRALRALEEEDFDILPGGIFNKGFVRAYVRYLGMDEEQAVADYMAVAGEPEQKDVLDPENAKILEANWKAPKHDRVSDEGARLPWAALLVLFALLAIAFSAWYFRGTLASRYQQWRAHRQPETENLPLADRRTTPESGPAAPSPALAPDKTLPKPKPDSGAKEASAGAMPGALKPPPESTRKASVAPRASVAGATTTFVVTLQAHEDSWLSIAADGKPAVTDTLTASHKMSIHAKQKLTLIVGNAGGVELSFNGQPQPTLGSSKEVRIVTFTPDGLQQ
jgi:cytoskeleton protein RodZ